MSMKHYGLTQSHITFYRSLLAYGAQHDKVMKSLKVAYEENKRIALTENSRSGIWDGKGFN